ncbi:hypothetical protein BKA63DRAFT_594823 [Paraphoma chrysanthemicola]|nr:hypothetical protein BKA63DRAFT_594823 [Paraphoma chrysanthemicola]
MTSLVGVRTALKTSDSEHAALFTSLLDTGKLVPYKSMDSIRRKLRLPETGYPCLGKKQAPVGLRKTPSLQKLQGICLRDLPDARKHYGDQLVYCPRFDADDADGVGVGITDARIEEEIALRTINSLTGTDSSGYSTIVTFPSESLEELCSQGYEPPDNLLSASMTTCTILPRNTLLPLHHSNEGTTITTLLSGSVIWMIWPPTDQNINTLRTAYENFAAGFDESKLNVTSELEGGMTFVQMEGDGLRIPPFCTMMCLSTTTSILATYSSITVEDFVSMLHKLPLLRAWFQTELNGARKQSDFSASLLVFLDLMLNGNPDDEDRDQFKLSDINGGLLHQLLSTWDEIKDDVAAMMGPADRKTLENIWGAYLISAKGRECRICHKSIRNKQKLMKAHFVAAHWSKVEATKRVDSLRATSEEANRELLQGSVHDAVDTAAEDGDAMEIDG